MYTVLVSKNPSGASTGLGKYVHLAAGNHLFAVDKPTWYRLLSTVQPWGRAYALLCTPLLPWSVLLSLSSDTAQHKHTTSLPLPHLTLCPKRHRVTIWYLIRSCAHPKGRRRQSRLCVPAHAVKDLCRLVANTGCFCKSVIAASRTCPLADSCKLIFFCALTK